MNITNMKITDIHLYEKNPRHNEGAVDAVAKSIKEFGWRSPIVVDNDHVIIVGHTRLKAAENLGLTEVPAGNRQVSFAEEKKETPKTATAVQTQVVQQMPAYSVVEVQVKSEDFVYLGRLRKRQKKMAGHFKIRVLNSEYRF